MRNIVLTFCTFIILSSCKDSYNYILRKGNTEKKYQYALKYFNKKKYNKAQPLLEDIYPQYRTKKESENIYYMLAYSHYKLKDYLLASYHFENFTQRYSLSSKVEECAFLHCLCEFEKSYPYYLDQTITENAIKQFQIFINNYPDSKYMYQCNDYIDKLRSKLHKKAYENAMLYYRTEDYKAAITAFENAVKDYPDIPQKSEIDFLVVKSYYLYAKKSILQLQPERLKKTIDEANNFLDEHKQDNSKWVNEMAKLMAQIKNELDSAENQLKKKNIN
ncbi:MAG: outer membrane protein assembly factor BamD [Bacteroidia bacterium]|nr:outer membrane protein assembly factor BamD [Bacteroidia bacterium]